MRRLAVLVLLSGVALSGCGGSSVSDLSASAATVLQRDAAALASAARAHDGTRVQAALVVLRRDVAAQRARQALSAERADRVLGAAALVAADVPPPAPSASPAPVVMIRPPAPPPPRRKHHHEDHGD